MTVLSVPGPCPNHNDSRGLLLKLPDGPALLPKDDLNTEELNWESNGPPPSLPMLDLPGEDGVPMADIPAPPAPWARPTNGLFTALGSWP
eukprot:Gb_02014 [translate_table: standard]